MPSLRSLAGLAVGLLTSSYVSGGTPKTCANSDSTPLSCHSSTAASCCYISPGGLLLQTQFWDTAPATGPVDSWTVHGLWPDNCDGTYEANCDPSREYTNISSIIKSSGNTALLSYMNTYWKDYSGNDETFWEHEWGKHGTCINTLDPDCYTGYTPQEEVVAYFAKAVELFKTRNSYSALAAAGITPSSSKTYTSSAISAALTSLHGATPYFSCKSGALNEIWYFFNVRGSAQTGKYVPTTPAGTSATCPSTGIKYLPKGSGGSSPTSTGGGSTPTSSPGTPFSGKGYLYVSTSFTTTSDEDDEVPAIKRIRRSSPIKRRHISNNRKRATGSCLISNGKWLNGATCATFTAASSGSGFTLTSSKGPCQVSSGVLSCASGNSATVFTSSGSNLSGSWGASSVPSGTTQVDVSTSGSTKVSISWTGA